MDFFTLESHQLLMMMYTKSHVFGCQGQYLLDFFLIHSAAEHSALADKKVLENSVKCSQPSKTPGPLGTMAEYIILYNLPGIFNLGEQRNLTSMKPLENSK